MALKQTTARRLLYQSIIAAKYYGWRGYAFAVGATFVAICVRLGIDPLIGHQALFAVFLPATLVTALAAGFAPAVLSVALSILFTLVVSASDGSLEQPEARTVVYAGLGLLNAWIGSELRTGGFEAARAEEDIRRHQMQITTIMQSVPDACVVIDRTGSIISFNEVAEQQFGYISKAIVGQNVRVLMPEPHASAHDGYLRHYAETGEKHMIGTNRTVHARRSDESIFPVRLSVSELHMRAQVYYVAFIRDLTEPTRTQAQLAQLQGELTRMARLSEIGEMATTLAHELNQPLTAIASFAQGSLRALKDLGPEASSRLGGALEETARQAVRAGRIMHRLREAALYKGNDARNESLRAIIEEAAELALIESTGRGVKTIYRYTAHADVVKVDRVQIQQVLASLIRNAIDSMATKDRKHLTISTRMIDDTGIAIDIADTGEGVSSDIASQLFQPFVSSKPGGLGMSLATSKRIVEGHGGQIRYSHNADGGATFSVHLPIAVDEIAK